jgi:retron-type reverse transcriptase
VDIDLKAFFDQVNHDKLMNLVGRKIRDKDAENRMSGGVGGSRRAPSL